ncbi:MAG: glycosyltransferase family 2 protein [Candidatus Levyibacteriota bacterium]
MYNMDVTISIVSYNTAPELAKCIKSIYSYTKDIGFEVIVIDNASTDGTIEMLQEKFPQVNIIRNKKNNFYSRANNQALKIAKGRYFLILNADTYFKTNAIKKLIAYMDGNAYVGACEGLELFENGKLIPNGSQDVTPLIDFYELSLIGKRYKNKKLVRAFRYASQRRDKDFEIEVGCDAFLLVRTSLLKKIKGYDENLKLYYTENDLCLRVRKEGYKVMHKGDAYIYHKVSVSANKLKWRKLDLYYDDMLCYYHKNGYAIGGSLLFILLKAEKLLLRLFRPNMFG